MTNTTSTYYKILNTILEYNMNIHFPNLSDIVTKVSTPSNGAIRVAINYLKHQSYIATKNSYRNYNYYLTEQGVEYIRQLEINEQKNRILEYWNRMFPLGD